MQHPKVNLDFLAGTRRKPVRKLSEWVEIGTREIDLQLRLATDRSAPSREVDALLDLRNLGRRLQNPSPVS